MNVQGGFFQDLLQSIFKRSIKCINQLIRWVGQKNVSLDYLLLGIGPVKRENLDFEKENRDLRKRIERLEGAIELAKDLLRDVFGKDIDEKKL